MITLNTEGLKSENDLIRYLSLLVNDEMPVEDRENALEKEYHLQMNEELREDVNDMCNYSDAIFRRGVESERKASAQKIEAERKASAQREEEREKRIAINLRTMGNTIENIAKSMEISTAKVRKWLKEAETAGNEKILPQ